MFYMACCRYRNLVNFLCTFALLLWIFGSYGHVTPHPPEPHRTIAADELRTSSDVHYISKNVDRRLLGSGWLREQFGRAFATPAVHGPWSADAPGAAIVQRRTLRSQTPCVCSTTVSSLGSDHAVSGTSPSTASAAAAVSTTSRGQLLLMKVKVLPVPAGKILRQLSADNTTSSKWTNSVIHSITTAAATQLGVPPSKVQVELQTSLSVGLDLPAAADSHHNAAASQAVAQFLEHMAAAGSSSLLVGVDLLRPVSHQAHYSNEDSDDDSDTSRDVIAMGTISGLGDVAETLDIAGAVQKQCPELFSKRMVINPESSDCGNLLEQYYSPILQHNESAAANKTRRGHRRSGSSSRKEQDRAAENSNDDTLTFSIDSDATALDTSAVSFSTDADADFAAVVVVPLTLKATMTITVNAASDQDAETLDTAAHEWLASDAFEDLLQQYNLHSGRGSPARLVTVMTSHAAAAAGDASSSSSSSSGAGEHWRHESAAQQQHPGVTAADQAGSGSTVLNPDHTGSATQAVIGEDLLQQITTDVENQQSRGQSVGLIVGTLVGAAVLGAAAALAFARVAQKRKQQQVQQQKAGSSDENGKDHGRRRRRPRSSRGIGKRYMKYLPSNLTATNIAAIAAATTTPPAAAAAIRTSLPPASTAELGAGSVQHPLLMPVGGSFMELGSDPQQQQQQQHGLLPLARAQWAAAAAVESPADQPSALPAGDTAAMSAAPAATEPTAAAAAEQQLARILQECDHVYGMLRASQTPNGSGSRGGAAPPSQHVDDSAAGRGLHREPQPLQHQHSSLDRMRSLLRWSPSAPTATSSPHAALVEAADVVRHAHSANAASFTSGMRRDLCSDSVSSAARYDLLNRNSARLDQAGSQGSPDAASEAGSSSSSSSADTSMHSGSRSSSRCDSRNSSRSLADADAPAACVITIGPVTTQQQQQLARQVGSSSSNCAVSIGCWPNACTSRMQQQQQQPSSCALPTLHFSQHAPKHRHAQLPNHVTHAENRTGSAIGALPREQCAISLVGSSSNCSSVPQPDTPHLCTTAAQHAAAAAAAARTNVPSFLGDAQLTDTSSSLTQHSLSSSSSSSFHCVEGSMHRGARASHAAAAAAGTPEVASTRQHGVGPSPFQIHYDFSALETA